MCVEDVCTLHTYGALSPAIFDTSMRSPENLSLAASAGYHHKITTGSWHQSRGTQTNSQPFSVRTIPSSWIFDRRTFFLFLVFLRKDFSSNTDQQDPRREIWIPRSHLVNIQGDVEVRHTHSESASLVRDLYVSPDCFHVRFPFRMWTRDAMTRTKKKKK